MCRHPKCCPEVEIDADETKSRDDGRRRAVREDEVLTIADIPDEYRKGDSDGESITYLASGVRQAIHNSVRRSGLLSVWDASVC
jgi:hypothetical protein